MPRARAPRDPNTTSCPAVAAEALAASISRDGRGARPCGCRSKVAAGSASPGGLPHPGQERFAYAAAGACRASSAVTLAINAVAGPRKDCGLVVEAPGIETGDAFLGPA